MDMFMEMSEWKSLRQNVSLNSLCIWICIWKGIGAGICKMNNPQEYANLYVKLIIARASHKHLNIHFCYAFL